MRKLSCLLFFIALFTITGCNQPVKVLLIMGGHAFDTAEFYMTFEAMEQFSFDPVYYPEALEKLKTDKPEDYDVLVFYDYNPELPMEDSSVFKRLTEKGKPLLFLHHSICTFQKWKGYGEMVGGKYIIPGFEQDSSLWSTYAHDLDLNVRIVDPGHPITMGMKDFIIHDEGYANLLIQEDVTPLLASNHPYSSQLLGWTHHFNRSAVVYLMLGHDKKAYENPAFPLLVERSITWLANHENTNPE